MSHWGSYALNVIIYRLIYNNIKNKSYSILYSPLPSDLISIIYGSLLGNGYGEKRNSNVKFYFYSENTHTEYLLYLHNIIANLGYCNKEIPKIKNKLCKKGKIKKIIKFNTWSLNQLNWIFDSWYINKNKILPKNINKYLTPLSLAIWIMDSGKKCKIGLKIITRNYNYQEHLILINLLKNKFNISAKIILVGKNEYNILIEKRNINKLYEIVKGYIIPSMKYKFY